MWGRGIVVLLALVLAACVTSASSSVLPTPDEHVQVRDETGWMLSYGFNPTSARESPSNEDPLRTRLFNPVGTMNQLVLVWFTGVCLYDRSVTLSAVDDRLRIDLYRGTPTSSAAECPAEGRLYTLGWTFDRDVPVASVDLRGARRGLAARRRGGRPSQAYAADMRGRGAIILLGLALAACAGSAPTPAIPSEPSIGLGSSVASGPSTPPRQPELDSAPHGRT